MRRASLDVGHQSHGKATLNTKALISVSALLTCFGMSAIATAGPITFFGEDLNFTDNPNDSLDNPTRPATLPNSYGARASFLANLVGVTTEDFEGFSNGQQPTSLTFGSDVATLIGNPEVLLVSTGTFNGAYPVSGDAFLFQFGPAGDFQIEFSTPQAAFGFFATDIGDGGARLVLDLLLDSGSTRSITVPHTADAQTNMTGSAFYFGFFDTDDLFTRVTFNNTLNSSDGFGFDNMTIGRREQVDPVAAPAPLALVTMGLVLLARIRARWQSAQRVHQPERMLPSRR
jgi:hypothetical protein